MQKITEVKGKGIVVRGSDIDTDRIIPARFLKEITFANMGNYAFFDERFDEKGNMKSHPFNDDKFKNSSILLVNKNFGCGSSREHAPQSLMRHGIKAIIGESFADIFSGNCTMIGLPTLTASQKEIEGIMGFVEKNPEIEIKIDINNKEIFFDNGKFKLNIKESSRTSLVEGTWDPISMMLDSESKIKETISKLPYISNFD